MDFFSEILSRRAEADPHAEADAHASHEEYSAGDHAKCWASFFILSLASGVIAPLFARIGLPKITGNLFVGALIGPYLLGLVSKADVDSLKHINTFALAYITTSAGAELHIHELKEMIKPILAQVTALELLTFAVVCIATKGLTSSPLSAWTNDMTTGQQWGVSMAMGSIAMARSPATAVAVVRDLKCKGNMTTTFMGITVLSDIAVLVSMALSIAYLRAEFNGTKFEPKSLGIVVAVIIASVLLGGVVGGTYMLLMRFQRTVLQTLVFPIGFLVFLACQYLTKALANGIKDETITIQPEPLLMCIAGGFLTVNYSKYHHRFIDVLGAGGQYIFLPFFTLVGASLDLEVFVKALPFAVIIALLRMLCIFVGSYSAGRLVGQDRKINLTIWMTLLSQAGFSLGLAAEIGHLFPGWGTKFQAVITSCVVVNQLIGPVLCNTAMKWSGEAGKATGTEAQDEAEADPHDLHVADKNKAVIVGITDKSKAIALSLLKRRWGVTVVARSGTEAHEFKSEVKEWAAELMASEAAGRDEESLARIADMVPYEDNLTVVAVKFEAEEDRGHPFEAGHASILKDLHIPIADAACLGPDEPEMTVTGEREDGEMKEYICPHPSAHRRGVSFESMASNPGHDGTSRRFSLPLSSYGAHTPRHRRASVQRHALQLGSESFVEKCVGIYDVLDDTQALQTVVLALDNDLAAMALLVSLQNRWGDKAAKIRVVVLVKELVWAEPITMLNAVPMHDFVLSHACAVLATATPLGQSAVLAPSTANLNAWSDAYLQLYEGDVLFHSTEQGKALRNVGELDIGSDAFVTVMNVVTSLMAERQHTSSFLTGGRMVKRIEAWLARKLEGSEGGPAELVTPHLLQLDLPGIGLEYMEPLTPPAHPVQRSAPSLERVPVAGPKDSCDGGQWA